jgi:hypothetical protein
MARKTFISYKYSESQRLRDAIINVLGDDASYYMGETAESPNISDTTVDNIKQSLRDMIYGTSVTIVIISPNYTKSDWIDWEIQYSLSEYSRDGRTSKTNGIVGVIMKTNGSYDWIVKNSNKDDGCTTRQIDNSKLSDAVKGNRYNLLTKDKYACSHCKSYDQLNGSYIALIDEDKFIVDPSKYIENAYAKSQFLNNYQISKK